MRENGGGQGAPLRLVVVTPQGIAAQAACDSVVLPVAEAADGTPGGTVGVRRGGVAPAAATARRSVSMRLAVLRTQPRPAAASRCAAGYYPLPIPIRRANAALHCECLFRLLKKKGS